MSACEKCWSDAFHRELAEPYKSQAQHYRDLIEERATPGLICSPKEQAGQFWDEEFQCDTRETLIFK